MERGAGGLQAMARKESDTAEHSGTACSPLKGLPSAAGEVPQRPFVSDLSDTQERLGSEETVLRFLGI